MDITIGVFIGIVTSTVGAIIFQFITRPSIAITKYVGERALRDVPGQPSCEFYHALVRNRRPTWLLPGARPAFACTATLQILSDDGRETRVGPVPARWPYHPEPLTQVGTPQGVVMVLDFARMMAARRVDIHNHEAQQLTVAVKYEGEQDCFLFTNESYGFLRWSNPDWRIGQGKHRLRVTVYYEQGHTQTDFWLQNSGTSRNQTHLNLFSPNEVS